MAELPKVFVTRIIPETGLSKIRQLCNADVWPDALPPSHDVIRARVADCDGLVSLLSDRIDAAVLEAGKKLRVVSNFAVGHNNIDLAVATARGISVGNTPGVLTDATADLAFCLLIACARRLVEGEKHTHSGNWKTWEPLGHLGLDLVGRTIGIVGMGRIGYALAKRCHAGWDMNVIYHDMRRSDKAERDLDAIRVDFDTLLRQSDFVSVHVDLNDQNLRMFSTSQFAKMKKTAIFVNTARGLLVDQRALHDALKSGTIFAAGLDVTDPEPPALDDPLLALPNLIIAPHIASATVGTRNAMAEICAQNLAAGLRGDKLPHCVNPEVEGRRRK